MQSCFARFPSSDADELRVPPGCRLRRDAVAPRRIPVFERFRDESPSFAGMAAFTTDDLRLRSTARVGAGVRPGGLGQLLRRARREAGPRPPDDHERRGRDPPVAVIGYGYWQRRFGGSPDAIGKTIVSRRPRSTPSSA